MTQANDLGAIANQVANLYRARVNANILALATQHYGAAEPAPMAPNMIWFSSGDGYIKLRNPTNTAWQTVGTIGPPMKWTNVDVPTSGWKTGDVKPSFNGAPEAGWIFLDDGTIGDQYSGATNRPNPDTWPLYSILWPSGAIFLYAAGTWTNVAKGASALADFNAHRHLTLPRACGRAMTATGQGKHADPGLGSPGTNSLSYGWWTGYNGQETVTLDGNQIPGHVHGFYVPPHGHPYALDQTVQNSWNSSGQGAFPTGNATTVTGPYAGWPAGSDGTIIGGGGEFAGNTGWAGGNQAHTNLGPRFYINLLIKL